MTCVAWDGKTLAADKQSSAGAMRNTVTKVYRIGDLLVGGSGDTDQIAEMREWVRRGRNNEDFPPRQRDGDKFAATLVIEGGRPLLYECSPYPIEIQDPVVAIGSGSAYALAAMFCGLGAKDAVMVAIHFDPGCGMGIDMLEAEAPT